MLQPDFTRFNRCNRKLVAPQLHHHQQIFSQISSKKNLYSAIFYLLSQEQGTKPMVIDSFTFFLLRSLFFTMMFVLPIWVLIPKTVFYYSEWKRTGKSKFLSAASTCVILSGFCLAADFAMFVSAFVSTERTHTRTNH